MSDISVSSTGELTWNNKVYRCVIGKNGFIKDKKEGDGGTPEGCFPIRNVFYRSDRMPKPQTSLPCSALSESDGWCDDPKRAEYNTLIKLPHDGSCEVLWREDHLYDLIVVIGYNDAPVVAGKGSAIFMHVARENLSPTAGCVALPLSDLKEIIKGLISETKICIFNKT